MASHANIRGKMTKNQHREKIDRRFDESYYTRYYLNNATRVAGPDYYQRMAKFVAAYSKVLDVSVRSIIDLGCGTGAFKQPLEKAFKGAKYVGVEASSYACETYGWEHASLIDYSNMERFDLVVCHDVLQYLNDREAHRAIKNFDKVCEYLLLCSVLTEEDWERSCDQNRTDGDVHLRSTDWYRSRLGKYFVNVGGGLFVSRQTDVVLYHLECLR